MTSDPPSFPRACDGGEEGGREIRVYRARAPKEMPMTTVKLSWTKSDTGWKTKCGRFTADRDLSGKFELFDGEQIVRDADGVQMVGVPLKDCKERAQAVVDGESSGSRR